MSENKNITFGLIKSVIDAHTMGLYAAASLLRDCGYKVIIAPEQIQDAFDTLSSERKQDIFVNWIEENNITHLGVSYRLDPDDAVNLLGRMVHVLKSKGIYESAGAKIKAIHFAGLTPACEKIDKEYDGRVKTFRGGETAEETLLVMGIPQDEIPTFITNGCKYDKELMKFGHELIKKGDYEDVKPLERNYYPEFGTDKDTLVKRLNANFKNGFNPLIRAHSGPYSADMTREQCLKEYNDWCHELADKGFLDVLSIGSSQLSQSNFGENWDGKPNGGGVPVNSEKEYFDIWEAARPMLVRTYSGTKNVKSMAKVYEDTINISWHALSLWWFDVLDGRGPNSLYQNLKEHIDTIYYIATTGKPVETNVSHHFSFRGADDVTYIISAYIAAKMVKKCGVNSFVLQNMLNTPRSTWGVQDLAKSRAMLSLVKELQDENFRVILQTRAGLDYFKPNLEEAKAQLAAVTAMMDDIDPDNIYSPEIIHVVSYSEAMFLATPDILNESIQITRKALTEYRKLKKAGLTYDVKSDDIKNRTEILLSDAKAIIKAMEYHIPNLYSPEGLYLAFVAGWLPTPELWSTSDEFINAKKWQTKLVNGGIAVVDHDLLVPIEKRIDICVKNMAEARRLLDSQK